MSAHRQPRRASGMAEARLAAIVNSSDDAIISKDLTGRIVSWNRAAEHLYGYAASEILGESIFSLIPEELKAEEEEILARIGNGERVEHYETCRLRKDGTRIEVSITVSPVYDPDGRIIGASKIARDISPAREAQRRKDQFLAVLAHELRNPLAPVRNAIEILRSLPPPSPQLQWTHDVIDRQVRQLSRLVDDLLDVSRITSGKIELRKERVELAAAVRIALESSRPVIERGGHELTVRVTPEPAWLDADLARLAQVLSNLVNNAAKYTRPGGHIWVTAERRGGEAVVCVRDNGIGIEPAMLARIFDMFTQAGTAGAHSQGGLGIGLTLARRLVELHGGRVEALSEGIGRGSEFVVHLPIAPAPDSAGAGREEPASPRAKPASRRILVVDDHRDAADSLCMLLKSRGHDVRVAYDGIEAVGAAVTFRPDVVLLDIGLPKLSGNDAARRIREAHGDGVTLVAVTGWGQDEDRRRAREAGFDHHLVKPVDLAAITRIIEKASPAP